ncbi:MAG: hypothetical protein ABID64_01005 [Nitrospirota bacterium]
MLIKRFFKIILSFFALIIAIVGFLIPILPGWPFLLGAVVLISPDHGKRVFGKIKDKWNKFRNKN